MTNSSSSTQFPATPRAGVSVALVRPDRVSSVLAVVVVSIISILLLIGGG